MDCPRTSALVIDGESPLAIKVLWCLAGRQDLQIHLLSSDPVSLLRYSRGVKRFLSGISLAEAVQTTDAQLLIACGMPGTEFLIREGSSFPNVRLMQHPALASFLTAKDKWTFHLAARDCGAQSPDTWQADHAAMPDNPPFPLLFKPRENSGGEGIFRVNNSAELEAGLRSPLVTPAAYIVQEFVDGRDFGCSAFCQAGRILASTIQANLPNHREGFRPAANIRFCTHDGVLVEASKILRHLNWTGVVNFDLRVRHSDGQAFLVDMNPRFWGSIYGSLRAGVDFVGLNCSLSPLLSKARAGGKINYYRGYRALGPWLLAADGDLGCRLRDPLPDLVRKLGDAKRKLFTHGQATLREQACLATSTRLPPM